MKVGLLFMTSISILLSGVNVVTIIETFGIYLAQEEELYNPIVFS